MVLFVSKVVCSLILTSGLISIGTTLPMTETHRITSKNLIRNPEFHDDGTGPISPAASWVANIHLFSKSSTGLKFDGGQAATQPQCLQFVPHRRVGDQNPCWCSQIVTDAVPGGRYRILAVIKGKPTAGVTVQWTKAGNWYGGSYPSPVNHTSPDDVWRNVSQEFVVPLDADHGNVWVSLFDGYMTPTNGSVSLWKFVELIEIPPPKLRAVVLSPSYRGRVTATLPEKLSLRVWIQLPSVPVLEVRLVDIEHQDETLAKVSLLWPNTEGVPVDLQFVEDPRTLLTIPGKYLVIVQCLSATNLTTSNLISAAVATTTVLATTTHSIYRIADAAPAPRVLIDDDQRLVVDGKPMFPLGLYYSAYAPDGMNATTLKMIGESPFNTIMPYDTGLNNTATSEYLDLCQLNNIKVIVDNSADLGVSDAAALERVHALRHHEAVLGWYTSDERGLDWLEGLLMRYKTIMEADVDHPTWSVFTGGQVGHLEDFMDGFDAVGTDPYPIGDGKGSNASLVRDWTTYSVNGVSGARPVWEVIQAFNHNNTCCPLWPKDGYFRSPTESELRSMAWQSICAGANGVVFYSFFELLKPSPQNLTFAEQWHHVSTVAGEIEPHGDVLLRALAPSPHVNTDSPWRMTRAHWYDEAAGVYMLYAVSDGDGGGETTFVLDWNIANIEVLAPGSTTRVMRTIEPSDDDSFEDTIEVFAQTTYRVTLQR
eukprot:m.63461 g.63461  ORF g.63461 m.63461 type:complete len:709 (+) comp23285_c0_seq1:121-2247(+)